MRPKTRGVKASKVSKENINTLSKTKSKTGSKPLKPTRKPLADKTNSASDENASPESLKKVIKTSARPSRKVVTKEVEDKRPRRNRRLPTRYVENQVLNNLSNSKENATSPSKLIAKTPVKNDSKAELPFWAPNNVLDSSLRASRPRRLGRLPSKFDESSISPNKILAIQPCHTSTPLVCKAREQPRNVHRSPGKKQAAISETATPQKVTSQKMTPQKITSQKVTFQKMTPQKVTFQKVTPQKISPETRSQKAKPQKKLQQKLSPRKVTPQKTNKEILVQKKLSEVVKQNPDTHSNEKQQRVRRLRKPIKYYKETTLSPKIKSPEISKPKDAIGKKISKRLASSYKVLEEKKNKNIDNQDIYEFTFDPTEEPPPLKKKRKKVPAKKPAQPKKRVYNNNYEKNLARALADLKNVVGNQKSQDIKAASKVSRPQIPTGTNNQVQPVATTSQPSTLTSKPAIKPNPSSIVISTTADIHSNPVINNAVRSNASSKNHASIHVEDIAADFEATMDHDINYSPINSPHANLQQNPRDKSPERDIARSDDPLHLRNDLSFFDEQPVASSSVNMSTRNPIATPWRVEFENLPIKWQADTYVKPDMTPALESSYINNFDDSKKKHVYTNMFAQETEALPEMEQNGEPKLKQTSIISFIKEVAERSAKKKNKRVVGTPKKANALFDAPNIYVDPALGNQTDTSVATTQKETSEASKIDSSSENNTSTESKKSQKRKHDNDLNPTPAKISRKEKDITLFGFDDSENQEPENVSPVKVLNTKRLHGLRSRSGAVLQEINKQTGPMRANLPTAMKSKLAPSSDVVEKMYDQIKSATDAPVLLDKPENGETTNMADIPEGVRRDEDSPSLHLFEDIELCHHFKPIARKSYGKAKKVTYGQNSYLDEAPARDLSSDDDVDDLSFHLPEFKTKKATKKKKTKKQLLSKKEKAEVDAWAASFNSMCEDIEEFDLVVE